MKRHIVLVGLPGSGKSTVGQAAAAALGAQFLDIDALITRREGRPISVIFAQTGEAAFRDMERKAVETALEGEPAIIAPGGGWAAQPGALESVGDRAVLIYLQTRPDTATTRARPVGNRPTLLGEDPEERMRALLAERGPFYLKAQAKVETDKLNAAQVTAEVVRLARELAGW